MYLNPIEFKNLLLKASKEEKEVVIICIGSDKYIFDSFGPVLGQLIKEKRLLNIKVYGTLDNPIHALNLQKEFEIIRNKHKNSFIIGVDASVTTKNISERIAFLNKSIEPGLAFNKKLIPVGDCSIIFRVSKEEASEIKEMRISEVYNECKKIVDFLDCIDDEITYDSADIIVF